MTVTRIKVAANTDAGIGSEPPFDDFCWISVEFMGGRQGLERRIGIGGLSWVMFRAGALRVTAER